MINLKLFFRLLKHMLSRRVITWRRICNFMKVALSSCLGKSHVNGLPPSVGLEPTAFCNLKCPLCPTGNGTLRRPKGYMPFDLYKRIIDEIGDDILHLTLWGYGEPFLVKDIYEMIAYAKKKRIFVRTSTNGHFFEKREQTEKLIESGLDNLIVALDGASQETLSQYRIGADFNKIIESLRSVMQFKKEKGVSYPFVELQFIAMRHNEHEIPVIKRIAQEIGVDKLTIKTTQYNTPEEQKPSQKEYVRSVKKEKNCYRLWYSTIITWDGAVVPCCYDHHNEYAYGVLDYEQGITFKNIWNNEKYMNFRKNFPKIRDRIDMCKECHGSFVSLNKD